MNINKNENTEKLIDFLDDHSDEHPKNEEKQEPIDEDIVSSFPLIRNWNEFLEISKTYFAKHLENKPQSILQLSDFEIRRTIGTGSFGRVFLVRHRLTKNFYALKVMDKENLMRMKQIQHLVQERNILNSIRFPFIAYLESSFKDNSNCYLVLPYIPGGEMFHHLRHQGKFSESLAKFYASQVVLAFEYLHSLNIIYRDLKPENIIIDAAGYIRIVDLGFAKVVTGRTWTICGTPEYIAPEIILSKGYGISSDWWSFGVLVYEMIAGYPPFHSNDSMKIYDKIVTGEYKTPVHFSHEIINLIDHLLEVNVSKRYGILKNGVNDIKNHNWFKDIQWLEILNRKIHAPYIPLIKNPGDSSNFDRFEESEIEIARVNKFAIEFADF